MVAGEVTFDIRYSTCASSPVVQAIYRIGILIEFLTTYLHRPLPTSWKVVPVVYDEKPNIVLACHIEEVVRFLAGPVWVYRNISLASYRQ
jgi:hypothetical protein